MMCVSEPGSRDHGPAAVPRPCLTHPGPEIPADPGHRVRPAGGEPFERGVHDPAGPGGGRGVVHGDHEPIRQPGQCQRGERPRPQPVRVHKIGHPAPEQPP